MSFVHFTCLQNFDYFNKFMTCFILILIIPLFLCAETRSNRTTNEKFPRGKEIPDKLSVQSKDENPEQTASSAESSSKTSESKKKLGTDVKSNSSEEVQSRNRSTVTDRDVIMMLFDPSCL
ncbi:hypothetical protein RB195_003841 [Necator americanus]|uniref:Uncharacterized protein n=1 Tax=Necator americanus TaxID=51031 RepID=A0ABR1DQG7_NECAM